MKFIANIFIIVYLGMKIIFILKKDRRCTYD